MMDDDSARPLLAAPWWRFGRYEIVDGVVRPTADAQIEPYDPWQDFLDHRQRGTGEGRVKPPYQALVDLWHGVRARDVDGSYSDLDLRQEKRLLEWCRRHGLLGLWHHEVLLALFPDAQQRSEGGRLRGYERASWGWREVKVHAERANALRRPKGPRLPEGLLAAMPREVWRSALPSGGFVLRRLGSEAISHAPLDATWKLYFDRNGPLGEPAWPVPSPMSPEFWRSYGEPVAMIMFAAQELEFAIEYIADGGAWSQASLEKLNALAGPVAPALRKTAEGPTLGWDSPSLLASLATMAITDAAGGARSVVCRACGAPFLTKAYQARYCSNRCKETARTRRRRARS